MPPKSILSASAERIRRAFTAATLLAMLCIAGCSPSEQLRKEASLRANLVVLRSEIEQFTVDHRRPPSSLSELVASGYLKQIPSDPFTGKNDTWLTQKSSTSGSLEVHSGSDAINNDGTKYISW